MTLPARLDPYRLRGLALRQLDLCHQAEMMRMQQVVLDALPDPAWFYPSEAWEYESWLQNREAFGYFDGDALVGFAAIAPWTVRGEHSYARVLGRPAENTYDFHDVMVLPAYRGRGIHSTFLRLFEEMARALGGTAIYATVDPGNQASWHNFEKAGYSCVLTKPAYDGRLRRYYERRL